MAYERLLNLKAEERPWHGADTPEEVDWTPYEDEELEEFASFFVSSKGFVNDLHQSLVEEQARRAKERHPLPEEAPLYVQGRLQEVVEEFWENHG